MIIIFTFLLDIRPIIINIYKSNWCIERTMEWYEYFFHPILITNKFYLQSGKQDDNLIKLINLKIKKKNLFIS